MACDGLGLDPKCGTGLAFVSGAYTYADLEALAQQGDIAAALAETAGALSAAAIGALAGIGLAGIGASLAVGAPPPTESLTGSGFDVPEPQPLPAASPPLGPPGGGGSPVATADELPPNWWDLANPPLAPNAVEQLPTGADIALTVAYDVVPPSVESALSASAQRAVFNAIGQPNIESFPYTALPADVPTGLPAADFPSAGSDVLPEVTITAPRPARAPLVVADPILAPVGVPIPGLAPLPLPAVAPRGKPRPGPLANPAADPLVSPGISPFGLPLPKPVIAPFPSPSPVRIVAPSVPGIPVGKPILPPLPLPIPTPTPTPAPLPWLQPQQIPPPVQTKTAKCEPQQKKKKKQQKSARSVCHTGTYTELAHGLVKHPRRVVQCR